MFQDNDVLDSDMLDLEKLQRVFAPTGKLRASINLGNPILANRSDDTGELYGVSVDLATEFANRLGLELELVVFNAAGKSVEAVAAEQADFGFFAIDPLRGEKLSFTEPYVLITGSYLVADDSPIKTLSDVDRAGNRVVVGRGSAYDLYLTRELKFASIERAQTSPTVVDTFLDLGCEVAAGVTQQLEGDLLRFPGHRMLPGNFMTIRQAMGAPKSRGDLAASYLSMFVETMKSSGFVKRSLAKHSIQGAKVAPLVGI
ncbi:ABC transporter substrate-binding protein [Oceanospirillum sanctuarii]|uniref:ABC transporter substrate-binding protein n=1 Tax=Oceanospirillum sanctuarii TaxID=1434821 RepID=UPI001FE855EA|nr:ABC transporter substrate-binding protein [Oceanospirillum sanctuarii]